ncbi:MAG TPA: GIY-YIG nuclease family protein [Phycisphaerae bacterium]|nr:GIY-YIG nuclease family protein [Phycisphaerae bacterium]
MNESSDSFWTYILENPAGRFYIGQTDDLGRRIEDHNSPDKVGTKFTQYQPWSGSMPLEPDSWAAPTQ